MKRYRFGGLIVGLLIVGAFLYYQFLIDIWGFYLPRNDLNTAIILTDEHNYLVTKHQDVLDLAYEVSNMKKLDRVDPNTFGKREHPPSYRKLLIQTKDNGTFGGSFWVDGTNVIQDSNGYYWRVNNTLITKMDKMIKDAKVLN